VSFLLRASNTADTGAAVWTEVPLSAVSLPTNAFSFHDEKHRLGVNLSRSGWLSCWVDSTLRLIWLPYERRRWYRAVCGTRVAIAGDQRHGVAALTVLKFPGREDERQSDMIS
jgi:hypothetical protein